MSEVSDVPWLDEDESATWRSWLVLSSRVRTAIGRDLARDHGLSEAEYAVLVNLSEAPERRVRMTDLAARLDWSRSRLSHLVGRMEARGLVARVDCSEDGRGSFAALTEVGVTEIARAAPGHVASVRRHFLDLLGRDQLLQLRTVTEAALVRFEALAGPCAARSGDLEAGPCAGDPDLDGAAGGCAGDLGDLEAGPCAGDLDSAAGGCAGDLDGAAGGCPPCGGT